MDQGEALLKAFGTDEDGKPVFKPAWDLINTSQRIRSALEKFPFRENIPPKTPDVFHFRLGASNFYVPPVAINVSSQFKTGSLTGGAIRQKNSPKFNAGYKETTISVKLFFPNYEEIWGIDIDGIQDLSLDKDFKIDFKLDGNEEKIDKFLSSLRGLVAAFKYAPILPVKNHYLNTAHGITGVALSAMSISTIPNYPFALVVDLELLNFNHKPFLPMIKDFNQAVHWGKFRHYMGKAAGNLHSYINESFFMGYEEPEITPSSSEYLDANHYKELNSNMIGQLPALEPQTIKEPDLLVDPFKEDIYTTNIIKEWRNGNNISIFIPAQTQTKIFTPDVSSFRSDEEKALDDTGGAVWESMLKSIGIDINQSASYGLNLDSVIQTSTEGSVSPTARRIVLESFDLILAGKDKEDFDAKVYDYYATSFVLENKNLLNQQEIDYVKASPEPEPVSRITTNVKTYYYTYTNSIGQTERKALQTGPSEVNMSLYEIRQFFKQNSKSTASGLEDITWRLANEKSKSTGRSADDFYAQSKTDVARAFNVLFYNRFFKSGPIQKLMEAQRLRSGNISFNEWEVPMIKVDLDPKSTIVNGISVTLANNLAKMQLQMQEEPTYQHIGGKDSYINISMTVFGEKELIKIRKVFEHINGLARLEHSTGVIGFMGIRNIVAGLAGIKYVVPLSYQVNTIPNFPHVYDVKISLVDFDVFQQTREKISSKQQQEFVDTFGTKRNPFLRIKQLWGAFNAYPDFPLSIKDENDEVVGQLDPDYYFRSFEMFDSDIINNVTTQQDKITSGFIKPKQYTIDTNDVNKQYDNVIMGEIRVFIQNNDTGGLKEYFADKQISMQEAGGYIQGAVTEFFSGQKPNLLIDFINEYSDSENNLARFTATTGVGFSAIDANTSVGDLKYNDTTSSSAIQRLLENQNVSISEEGYVGVDPDMLQIHHLIQILPAVEDVNDDKLPAFLYHANGYYLGYVSKTDNLFYFTVDNIEAFKDVNDRSSTKFKAIDIPFSDTDDPANAYDKNKPGAAHNQALGTGGSNLAESMNGYSSGDKDVPEGMATNSKQVNKHWERMLIDTQYRDISGRMLRAFPTYMLWLIDEGGYSMGVKLFDNFYGLQSVIDFSIVQSEDILGDTLILRVSNLYSKLTTKESTDIFNRPDEDFNNQQVTQTDGLESVLDTIINRTRNIRSGTENEYIVNINNIRLKPGARVHLRAGYGSNPNSLQTLFNGIITQVETGEIVTITAQSDAIELSPIINSTNKKGDSGKIDGGINTGLWLSEPRDLMVRLLSMGSSRTREALAHATRGSIFSENKFGIRHFGSILYEPLTPEEQAKVDAVTSTVKSAFDILGEGEGATFGVTHSLMGVLNSGQRQQPLLGLGPEVRLPGVALMQTLWANLSSQRDFEIFKRNIYPGNGTGIAQFLGGDLGDGWASVASITPEETPNERLNYIGRVTDYSWNNLTASYGQGNVDAKVLVDSYTSGNQIGNRNGSGDATKVILSGGLAVAGVAAATLGAPIVATVGIGAGLLGVLSGRSGTNLFNAMGITSSMDDDLPGLDEVSFRAQTYMRSVWDIFQLCARLLPNYIVAIRPFEDRSTVFYGKPHWLYTSGVVPLTSGYDLDDKTGKAPKIVEADEVLAKSLEGLNKISNPLADSAAFSLSSKSLVSKISEIEAQMNPSDSSIYIPEDSLKGKLIAFGNKSTSEFKGQNGQILAKLPATTGVATIGFHLPIVPDGSLETEALLEEQQNHVQIPQLPLRYRFPFFTDRADSIPLEDYAYYSLSDRLGKWSGRHQADWIKLAIDDWSFDDYEAKKKGTSWIQLLKQEAKYIETLQGVQSVDYGVSKNSNNEPIAISLNKNQSINFASFSLSESDSDIANGYIYSEKTNLSSTIRMPYPDLMVNFTNKDVSNFSQEYQILANFKNVKQENNAASMREWGAPSNPKDEQFYIAMKWPYKPGESSFGENEIDQETIQELYSAMGISAEEAVGSARNYKDRKVLVYSPTTGRAVVCRPAYYLWGEDTIGRLEEDNSRDSFGNNTKIGTDSNSQASNELATEERTALSAIVSPDAAYFLGMMNLTEVEKTFWSDGEHSKNDEGWGGSDAGNDGGESAILKLAPAGIAPFPIPRVCYYAFVPDTIPVGVIPDLALPAQQFIGPSENSGKIIGFGKFSNRTSAIQRTSYNPELSSNEQDGYYNFEYDPSSTELTSVGIYNSIGGNLLPSSTDSSTDSYFSLVKNKEFTRLSKDSLNEILGSDRKRFAVIYDESDEISVSARKLFDQDFDLQTEVVAGDGRTLQQAAEIWNQFRIGYHTYTNVKESFQAAYGLDPDSEEDIGDYLGFKNLTTTKDFDTGEFKDSLDGLNQLINSGASLADIEKYIEELRKKDTTLNPDINIVREDVFKKFGSNDGTAKDEFDLVFGDFNKSNFPIPLTGPFSDEQQNTYAKTIEEKYYKAIEFSRENFIDSDNEDGLIKYFNVLLLTRINSIIQIISEGLYQSGVDKAEVQNYIASISTPKQLFLFVVGAFRNAMWTDSYSRAWLVLKPNRKMFGEDKWDFNPVLKIFQAYINPNNTFAKDKNKFKKLLAQNRGEGQSATNIVGRVAENVDSFVDRNIGPIISGLGDALSGLVNMFRMSMMQLGYGLSNIGQMTKQANVLNKALNDSIYYSLGRPGSLLRAVDNPFTREYGEPVIEIREPFQRVHYISSFSHIISNAIQENISGVATTVTAVSDGKYPVTVALDKSVPSERQVEKTIETGIYFDNASGSGLLSSLHPILHPLETIRGISKIAQGTPDELLAKRVGLAHLKESLKDIYGGEIVVIGNPDIRPHDLVYLADVYERMYGLFEVEQVVHHFTSELGFITSITPNALVTVNDPSRWFMSSWIGSWLHMQALRNDTRLYMNSLGSGVNASGQISVDGLSDSLNTQMVGGLQYTHGASAITKDVMAHFTSVGVQDINSQVQDLVKNSSAVGGGQISPTGVGAVFAAATGLGATAGVFASLAVPGAGLLMKAGTSLIGAGLGGKMAWKGWSWIRDNVLDQHGCYIQYLNKNGQAMDAGLNQAGQGMVVGRYHTKKLLPGILGVTSKVRTSDGHSYIRTNDLLKNLGWKEKEITDLVRYISFENALVNSQVLKYSGTSPNKTGFGRFFKVIAKVTDVLDGDTIDVVDVFDNRTDRSENEKKFRIRFDGINTPEINIIKTDIDTSGTTFSINSVTVENNRATFTTNSNHSFRVDDVVVISNTAGFNTSTRIESVNVNRTTFTVLTSRPDSAATSISGQATVYWRGSITDPDISGGLINPKSPGGKASLFTQNAILNKLVILRISPSTNRIELSVTEENFEAGNTSFNNPDNYQKDVFGSRTLATVFYKAPSNIIDKIITESNSIFVKNIKAPYASLVSNLGKSFYEEPFNSRYTEIRNSIPAETLTNYVELSGSSLIKEMSFQLKEEYNRYVAARVLKYIYDKVSEWPNVDWDEYYEDGTPVSLNWELITENLASVYTKGLLIEQPSVITSSEMI
jgi:hypothetical protein